MKLRGHDGTAIQVAIADALDAAAHRGQISLGTYERRHVVLWAPEPIKSPA